ncbi:MAG TPA: NUDIX domain-containing protein [Patescibacteria group bacterium]|nr:NUDIX domain-containing protein [Patescibacteria group bacterium]
MPKHSAGILLYRSGGGAHEYEMLIVHPGGPFWAKRDLGAWSIPKGEFTEGEEVFVAAKREFQEEMGVPAPVGDYEALGEAKQGSGKIVHIFALASDFNLERFKSNMFTMEWPPKSGVQQEFPECDRAAWVSMRVAKEKLVKGQVVFLEKLASHLQISLDGPPPMPQSKQASLF